MKTFIAKILKAVLQKENGVPGKSIDVDLETIGSNGDDAEQSYPAGIMGVPQKDIQGVGIKVNGQNIIVSNLNYGFDKSIDNGSTMLYGYDESGVVKGYVLVDSDGLLAIKNKLTSLKTILDNFSTEGGPAKQFTSAETKLEIAKLFKE